MYRIKNIHPEIKHCNVFIINYIVSPLMLPGGICRSDKEESFMQVLHTSDALFCVLHKNIVQSISHRQQMFTGLSFQLTFSNTAALMNIRNGFYNILSLHFMLILI